jgi:hypothetical protein
MGVPPELLLLELLDELDELDELLELDDELELLLDELEELDDEPPPTPLQLGTAKLPSWLPWKPNEVEPPGLRLPFQLMLLAVTLLPEVDRLTFQLPVTCGGSLKARVIDQLLIALPPLLVTVTSS